MTISKGKSSSPASAEQVESKREISLEDEFQSCAAAWKRDTSHLSVEGEIASHEAYQSIIGMGEKAIPLILNDLKREPKHWFLALSAITNDAPKVAERDKGKMNAISDAWIEWGRDKGYIE